MQFTTKRRVEFRDTDSAGIAHFSTFFVFMEQAEHELLRHLGLSVVMDGPEGTLSWPRVRAACDFRRPIKFEEVMDVEVVVDRLGEKSTTYGFRFTHDSHLIATGQLVTVCARMSDDDAPQAIPIPNWIREKLQPYIAPPTSRPSTP